MLKELGYWLGLLFLAGIAYWAPGYALLSLLAVKGIGRIGRILLGVPVSLVLVPYVLAVVGSIFPLVPSSWMLVTGSLLLFAGAWLRERMAGKGLLTLRARNHGASSARPVEWVGVSAFILAFAALVGLPNIELFVHGDQALVAGTWDSYWHIAELTSVARSGIPPLHYFFPDASLSYYYWSWIYPAAIVNQGLLRIPLARAYALHVFVQVAAFLGLCYYFLRLNLSRPIGRLSGLAFLTVFGGFDLFVGMASGADPEWWQKSVAWLISPNQISSFVVLYAWVPQHLAGGLAFVLGLLLWRNMRAPGGIRWGALGVLLAFTLGTSAFVFMASGLAILLWAICYRKALLSRRVILPLALAIVLFGLGSWHQLATTLGQGASIGWSSFRVPFVEKYVGIQTSKAVLADRVLTFLFFPVVGGWVLLIEIGLPFVLYVLWSLRRGMSGGKRWGRFLLIFPGLSFLLVCLFVDKSGADDLAMRGMIPAQIAIVLAAATYMDGVRFRLTNLAAKLGAAYLILIVAAAQATSWTFDLQTTSRDPIGSVLRVPKPVFLRGLNIASAPGWPNALAYINWINVHTPNSALIVEGDPLPADNPHFRLLERMRFVSPESAKALLYDNSDLNLVSSADRHKIQTNMEGRSVLQAALNSDYVKTRNPEIFYVARNQIAPDSGKVVYRDQYVTVYEIEPRARTS